MSVVDVLPQLLTIDTILSNSEFAEALRRAALKLIDMHDAAPRIVRYTADMRRWLLTQAMLALHFAHLTDPGRPVLTAANLIAYVAEHKVASKNTTAAHLVEMRTYRLLIDAGSEDDRRTRPLVLASNAEVLIRDWFDGHLAALDRLDGGGRLSLSLERPALLWHAQPRMFERLFRDPAWSRPPVTVSSFVKTASGSNILHALMARLPAGTAEDGRYSLGPLRIGDLARRFIISRSHAQRVIARARDLAICGWIDDTDGDFWVSETLVADYRHWQAVKFAAIEEAFSWACDEVLRPR